MPRATCPRTVDPRFLCPPSGQCCRKNATPCSPMTMPSSPTRAAEPARRRAARRRAAPTPMPTASEIRKACRAWLKPAAHHVRGDYRLDIIYRTDTPPAPAAWLLKRFLERAVADGRGARLEGTQAAGHQPIDQAPINMVRPRGLEPPPVSRLAPQASASTNSAMAASAPRETRAARGLPSSKSPRG